MNCPTCNSRMGEVLLAVDDGFRHQGFPYCPECNKYWAFQGPFDVPAKLLVSRALPRKKFDTARRF